jgi:hypothetical protein
MANLAALGALFVALLAAPLALGTYVVVQRSSQRAALLWFGLLAGLLGLSLLFAAVGLWLVTLA